MITLKMQELGTEEGLTFSLISSNQLRTVGNIHSYQPDFKVANLVIVAKRQVCFVRKMSYPTQPLVALNPDRRRRKDADQRPQ